MSVLQLILYIRIQGGDVRRLAGTPLGNREAGESRVGNLGWVRSEMQRRLCYICGYGKADIHALQKGCGRHSMWPPALVPAALPWALSKEVYFDFSAGRYLRCTKKVVDHFKVKD